MKLVLATLFCAIASSSGFFGPHQLIAKKPRAPVKVQSRVFRGFPAKEGKVPYIVGLYFNGPQKDDAWCGGSIIDHTWILTAAHCARNKNSVKIFFGSTKLAHYTLTHDVDKANFIEHPQFNFITFSNDLALIRIPYVEFTNEIKKVQLADHNKIYDNSLSYACGWGDTADNAIQAHDLQCAGFRIMSNLECTQRTWPRIDNTMLCVDTSGGSSTCGGDSGGPLVTKNNPQLVGVTSFGGDSCENGRPEVFSRVSTNLDWIRNVTGIM